jgi:carbamoyl-phosphate synthase large subunit
MLQSLGIPCLSVAKTESGERTALALIEANQVDLVINVPREYDALGRPDGYLIRRSAVDHGVPLITDLQLARAVIEALRVKRPGQLSVIAWNDFLHSGETAEQAAGARREFGPRDPGR